MNQPRAATIRISSERLDEIVRRLVDELSPQRIYLFGSQLYGEPTPDSDVDLLILLHDEELASEDQDERGYRCLRGLFLPIELHFHGEHEFARRATVPCSFEHEVLSKGRLLYAA